MGEDVGSVNNGAQPWSAAASAGEGGARRRLARGRRRRGAGGREPCRNKRARPYEGAPHSPPLIYDIRLLSALRLLCAGSLISLPRRRRAPPPPALAAALQGAPRFSTPWNCIRCDVCTVCNTCLSGRFRGLTLQSIVFPNPALISSRQRLITEIIISGVRYDSRSYIADCSQWREISNGSWKRGLCSRIITTSSADHPVTRPLQTVSGTCYRSCTSGWQSG